MNERAPRTVMVVLGKNIGIGWRRERIQKQKYHLSDHSRISVLAAGILYTRGEASKLVFSSGPTAGSDIASEAQLMKTRLQQIWPSIPDEDIILEEESTQTKENAPEVKRILDAHPELEDVDLVTVGFHLRRAKKLFARSDIKTAGIKSEEVVSRYFPEMMKKYERGNIREKIKEAIGTPFQLYLSPLARTIEDYVRKSRS